MKFKMSDIAKTIPSGGYIVSMVTLNGYIYLATSCHLFRGKEGEDEFQQMLFRELEEIPETSDEEGK